MATAGILERAITERWSDQEVVDRVRAGETALYEILMRRYNQRLYRVSCAILRNRDEAEDVMQDAYVRAYQHLDQFAGHAPFSIWLTRIAVNEALSRLRQRRRSAQFEDHSYDGEDAMSDAEDNIPESSPDPEQRASITELGRLLEEAVLDLPEHYRAVVMLRDVEELTTAETAAALELTEENVKVRLHRGHAMMRDRLFARVGTGVRSAFPFMGERCDRVVAGVFARLGNPDPEL